MDRRKCKCERYQTLEKRQLLEFGGNRLARKFTKSTGEVNSKEKLLLHLEMMMMMIMVLFLCTYFDLCSMCDHTSYWSCNYSGSRNEVPVSV